MYKAYIRYKHRKPHPVLTGIFTLTKEFETLLSATTYVEDFCKNESIELAEANVRGNGILVNATMIWNILIWTA